MTQPGLLLALIAVSSAAFADPAPLVIDKSIPDMASPRHIRNVHAEVATRTTDLGRIRSAILSAMESAKGGPWTAEDEGSGYVLAKMHYRDYYGFAQNLRGSIERALKRR